MNGRFQFALSVAALCACGSGAIAQNVYRCGDSYSQQPCAGGTVLQADDARSEEQRRQARVAAERDARAGDALEKARLKQEAMAAPGPAASPRLAAASDATRPVLLKPKKRRFFTAVELTKPGDGVLKKKKKAKRRIDV